MKHVDFNKFYNRWLMATVLLLVGPLFYLNGNSLSDITRLLITNDPPIIRAESVYINNSNNSASAAIFGSQVGTFFVQDGYYSNGVVLPSKRIYGKSFDYYWMIGDQIIKIAKCGDEIGEAKEIKSAVEAEFYRVKSLFRLGVLHLGEPAVMSSSNEVTGFNSRFGSLRGRLYSTSEGIGINYVISSQTNRIYTSLLDDFSCVINSYNLRFQRTSLQDGKIFKLGTGYIRNLNLGITNLAPLGGYVPSMFIISNSPKTLFLMASNKSFSISENGEIAETPKLSIAPDENLLTSPLTVLSIVLLFFGLNGGLILWLTTRAGNK